MGYKIYIAFMQVPKEVSVERALGRYQNSGRYVPMFVIDEYFKFGGAGFQEIKDLVDGYIVVDGVTQELIESGGEEIPNLDEKLYDYQDGVVADPKAEAQEQIDALKISLDYLDSEDKLNAIAQMEALEISLDYL